MGDQVGSRHSLVFEVYETSFSPTDLTSHLNVTLECGCVLSRISTMRDEVIGYKSPVGKSPDPGASDHQKKNSRFF